VRLLLRGVWLGATVLFCSAHLGSPDAWYEGPAGPYRVRVHVQAPPVIPGIAVVNVYAAMPGLTRVTAYVNRFDAQGSPPPPDVAEPVAGSPGWYRTRLWVMTAGSNGVTVALYGPEGEGSVVVPLAAVAARRLAFAPPLAALLLVVALVLVAGLFTIVGAAVRESTLPPGAEPDRKRRRRARFAVARAMLVVTLALSGWVIWWRANDRRFVRNLFRPLALAVRIDSAARPRLILTVTDSVWSHRHDGAWLRARRLSEPSELLQDHGKLVHLFLVATGGRGAFAHLHPVTSDTTNFTATLPPLPGGTYLVFADVVHTSGFTETLTSTLALPEAAPRNERPAADPDDSWTLRGVAPPVDRAELEDGSTLSWLRAREPLLAGTPADLRFVVAAPAVKPAPADLYLGMAGHAAVMRDDGAVFIHLHPLGTISLAAQAQLRGTTHAMNPPQAAGDTLYFPYAFPREGNYTVWVQLKRGGRVLTGAFGATVLPASR
jgi:hypothetical protein